MNPIELLLLIVELLTEDTPSPSAGPEADPIRVGQERGVVIRAVPIMTFHDCYAGRRHDGEYLVALLDAVG